MSYQKSPRQKRLERLARNAWPDRSVEVVSSNEDSIHVWDAEGKTLLSVRHPLADEVIAVLGHELGAMSINAAINAVELILRARMARHGIDVVGIRDGKIVLWDEDGEVAGGGSTLLDAVQNLDKRSRNEGRWCDLSELSTDQPVARVAGEAEEDGAIAVPKQLADVAEAQEAPGQGLVER